MGFVSPYADPQRAERDGVPVFWGEGTGECTGALLVRSGKADETARTSGINHLVEHMALFPVGRPAYQYNGVVEDTITLFYAKGEPEEVAGFLSQVCASLSDLPLDRLPVERRILLTEAGGRDLGIDGRLLALRFGARGYGLYNFEELGLGWLEGSDVERWIGDRFTSGNAAAWMSAEPPDGLSLALPPGPLIPPPAPQPIPTLELPCELEQGTGGIAFSVLGERSFALSTGLSIAVERAHARLRREAGLSYSVTSGYLPLDAHTAHATLNADCRDTDARRVRDELLAVVDELASDGPTDEELEFDRRQVQRALEDPDSLFGMLDRRTRDELMGAPFTGPVELMQEREALTGAEVAEALGRAATSLLVVVPAGTGGRPARLRQYASAREEPVAGARYMPTEAWRQWQEASMIIVGPTGVTLTDLQQTDALTVLYDECVAVVPTLSGGLTLIDQSGAWITVTTSIFDAGAEAAQDIRNALDPSLTVPFDEQERRLLPIVQQQLPVRWHDEVPRELDRLPPLLADDEGVDLLARARRGPQVGLLVLTDRRLLFLFVGAEGTDLLDIPRAEIERVTAKGVMRKKLGISAGGATHEFTELGPPERLVELRDALAAP